jgi:hypothetical protein
VSKTIQQYDLAAAICEAVFVKKTKDYGTAWRILRTSSLTDQLFIKAKRIRSLETNAEQKIDEGVESEYIGLINYSAMALIQIEMDDTEEMELPAEEATKLYQEQIQVTKKLMLAKNHDYGEAWRDMRISSLTDLILMKILRLKQIEDNNGKTIISEGPEGSYRDIINYAMFALIKLSEK